MLKKVLKFTKLNKLKLLALVIIFLYAIFSSLFSFNAKPALAVFTAECTGGTITRVNGKTIHTFLSSGTLTCASGGDVEYLVVAGGGGGGNYVGGGGGAGGVRTGTLTVTAGNKTVVVGAGGASATKGNDSIFDSITAVGGGAGGPANAGGGSGGSGGGGGMYGAIPGPAGSASPTGQGNNGGSGATHCAGGGGGAGGVGANCVSDINGGNGGIGIASSISGSSVTYAGGGGGGTYAVAGPIYLTPGSGGSGIGGNGRFLWASGYPGIVNTGSGGGGAGSEDGGGDSPGGAGGSGIVIVSYATPAPAPAGNPASGYAWGELAGWINLAPTGYETVVGTDKLTGWAWSENLGWISMDCANPNGGSCAANFYRVINTNGTLSGYAWGEQAGYIDFAPTGGGVSVGANGVFSGYAWGEKTGWISFSGLGYGVVHQEYLGYASDYAYGEQAGWIRFDNPGMATTTVYNDHLEGYAYSEQLGWINLFPAGGGVLNDGLGNLSGSAYGEQAGWIDFAPAGVQQAKINFTTNEFEGWAYGEQAGWVSFNCLNTSSCGATDYKVRFQGINFAPAVASSTAPNWNFAQASVNALRANLQFSFVDTDAGSTGSAYQLILKKADDTAVLDTGVCTGYNTPSAACKIDNTICMNNGAAGCVNPGDCVCQYALDNILLNYNQGYKWWVKVWDNNDTVSDLTAYDTVPDTDNDDGVVPTFTTYKHEFPKPSATYVPANPSRGERIKFTDTSKTYLTAAPTTQVPCDPAKCSWLWTVPGDASINDSATSTPTVIFGSAGNMSVTLKVTDLIDGYYASAVIPVNVNVSLPRWKEVKPE